MHLHYQEAGVTEMFCNGRGTNGRVRMTPGQDNWNVDIFETPHHPRHLSLGQIKIVKTDLKMTQAILAHKFSSA